MSDRSVSRAGTVADRAALLREPALPVLLLALVAMVKRGYALDVILVAGAAVVLVADATRWRGRTADARPSAPSRHRVPLILAVAVLSLALGWLPAMSRAQDVAFTVIGTVVLWAVWSVGSAERARGDEPDPWARGRSHAVDDGAGPPPRWWLWPAAGVALCLVELSTLVYQPEPRVDSVDHPSLSTVVEPALFTWPGRAAFVAVWLLSGWWLLRRIRAWAP